MIKNRIAIFAAAAGFLGMAGLLLAKEKGESGMSEYTKGNQFFEAKQYEQAVAEFAKAIEANSKQPAFYENRGFAYIALEKGKKEAADFSKPINLRPKKKGPTSARPKPRLFQKINLRPLPEAGRPKSSNP